MINSCTYNHFNRSESCESSALLKNHAKLKINDGGKRQSITVRCKHVWTDTKSVVSKPTFNPAIGLSITFVREDGIDAGGLLREYFQILWDTLKDNNDLFTGPTNMRVLAHNIRALQDNHYRIIGNCIALSLMYGGSAPRFFSQGVVAYLLGDNIDKAVINEIPDVEIKEKVGKVYFS